MVISDEVYEHMGDDGATHLSAASFPGLAERAFIVSSFGKTYHVTGWKIAYCLAPKALMAEFRKVHQFVVFTVHTPSQHAIARYMQYGTHNELSAFYQVKRDFFLDRVSASRFTWHWSPGTYFVCASYAHIEEFNHYSEQEFARKLIVEAGVASIPMSAFYHGADDHRVVRFCFARNKRWHSRRSDSTVSEVGYRSLQQPQA